MAMLLELYLILVPHMYIFPFADVIDEYLAELPYILIVTTPVVKQVVCGSSKFMVIIF